MNMELYNARARTVRRLRCATDHRQIRRAGRIKCLMNRQVWEAVAEAVGGTIPLIQNFAASIAKASAALAEFGVDLHKHLSAKAAMTVVGDEIDNFRLVVPDTMRMRTLEDMTRMRIARGAASHHHHHQRAYDVAQPDGSVEHVIITEPMGSGAAHLLLKK